ncbi:MAG: hypothetical protein LAO56_22175 [Acidobacteriia bacterium]|nr:hypothetical protein [Terriglobia bacterium]
MGRAPSTAKPKLGTESHMIYIKSLLAGFLAVVVACISLSVLAVVGLIVYNMIHRSQEEGSIGWDPISLVRVSPWIWFIVVLIFCVGFFWEYRRLAK